MIHFVTMKVEARKAGEIPVISASGRITIGESTLAFKAALDQAVQNATRDVMVDGSRIDYMDSTGLGEIIAAARTLFESGRGRVGIISPSVKLQEIFEITGLDRVFVVGDSESAVVEALAGAGKLQP